MRELKIFDFDDTLAKSETPVLVRKKDGSIIKLTPGEFATYKSEPSDELDFTYFNKMIKNAAPIKHNVNLLKKYLSNPGRYKVTILTARALAFPIKYWLKKMTGYEVYVIAVAGSNPKLKADYIENEIRKGYTDIFFIDDSLPNVTAIKELEKTYPNVKINAIVAEEYFLNKIQNSLNEEDPCWTGYKQIGMKKKNGKKVPNCVPIKEILNTLTEDNAEQVLKDTPAEIEDKLAKFLNISTDELEKQALANKDNKEEQVNESIAITVLLALPFLLELAGEAINKAKTLSLSKEDKVFYKDWKARKKAAKEAKDQAKLAELKKEYQQRFTSKYGESLIGAGHELHKAYVWPIEQALRLGSFLPGKFGNWAKNPDSRKKIADIMYAVTMLFYGGIHAKHGIESLLSTHGIDVANFTTAVIDALKSGKSLKDVISSGLEIAGAVTK